MIRKKVISLMVVIVIVFGTMNIQAATTGGVSVKDFGAVGDGTANDTASIQSAIESASQRGFGTVYFPKGTYVVSGTIHLYSNVSLVGIGEQSIINTTMTTSNQNIFSGTNVSDLRIENLTFSGSNKLIVAIGLNSSNNITITNNHSELVALLSINSQYTDETITDTAYCYNIFVTENICGGINSNLSCIEIKYTNSGIIEGNSIANFASGIVCNGGNTVNLTTTDTNNKVKPFDLVISNNIINNMSSNGILISMYEKVSLGGNVLEECKNSGIELAAVSFGTIMGNTAKNCNNGLATSYECRGININGNGVYSDIDGAYLFKINNTEKSSNNTEITLVGNSFYHTGSGKGIVGGGYAEKVTIEDNYFSNTVIDICGDQNRYTVIANNQILFENALKDKVTAITAGKNNNNGHLMIQGNQIIANDTLSYGSTGIYAVQNDNQSTSYTHIKGNSISGFDVDIEILADSPNPDLSPVFVIQDNTLGNSNFVRSEGNTQKSYVKLEGNHNAAAGNYPNTIPVSGKWEKAQMIYFDNPTVGGYMGAVCIAKGSPGIWKKFGNVVR